MAAAAFLPWAMAWIMEAGPVTTSPPAKPPFRGRKIFLIRLDTAGLDLDSLALTQVSQFRSLAHSEDNCFASIFLVAFSS